jgi:solute carrier family 66 (lysosomal lysine-arginine transporter), member 1
VKNQRERSCEGLSLLFFLLSLLGNATYGAGVSWPSTNECLLLRHQILFHSVERSYVLKNLPWYVYLP